MFSTAYASNADLYNLSEQSIWSLLIHSKENRAQITDPKFLLSAGSFSAQSELKLTLEQFQQHPYETFCRFPARISYLSEQMKFDLPEDRFSKCPELKAFLEHVPFDSLELVYASEVLSSATSMMGHIFIKASGLNSRAIPVEHSLAYYTEITTFNPLKLVIESTMTGMPGFFSVKPFAKDVEQYIKKEQRNLWQFSLQATPGQLHLLQLHIWELNQVNITYYFQSFNCATLTLEMLALLEPSLLKHRGTIVSPADVVKAAVTEGVVTATSLDTAPHWLFHALRDSIAQKDAKEIDQLVFARKSLTNETRRQQLIKLAADPLAARYITSVVERAIEQDVLESGFTVPTASKDVIFDFTGYKHPAKTPQDSAFGVTWLQDEYNSRALLHYLPAGHFLHNDNRQYLSESELIIAKVSVAVTPDTNKIQLEEFTLYSFRSISPDHAAFPVLSGEFYLGYRQSYQQDLQLASAFEVSGALGKSLRLHRDIISYAMAGAGLTTDVTHSKAFIYAKAGVVMNLIGDTKLYIQYEKSTGKIKNANKFADTTAILSWFPDRDHSINLKLNLVGSKKEQRTQFGAEYFYHF
ncbi:hypothetical protein WG68_12015 [Arsukibacterium ikkense]|uniref:Uncharacterized protein n=2 Tax=Arsukibacterium ikkense TaxID=336831 RepID=A0A0M2V2T5_9GAMM|nr:hypothetical protein WG68_12015 [Arsukibacterium ikkense]